MTQDPRRWSTRPFVPAAASPELWAAFHAYRRARHLERSPEDPLETDAVVQGKMLIDSTTWRTARHYVDIEGAVVGFAELESPLPGTPEYGSNRHLVYASLAVIRPHRRRGIGTALLRCALEELRLRDARVLTAWTTEDDGQSFARHCGAIARQVERISRLDLDAVDWAELDRWIADLAVRAQGARLELYPNRLPEAFLAEYCPARTTMLNLMPWDDMDHGDIVVTPEDFHETYRYLDVSKSEHHTYVVREADGTISGITDVCWSPDQPTELQQWFTGVHPGYRGRGLGKALKAAMLRYVRARYPGLRFVRTGNAASNASMLRINERMGFVEYRRYTTYQIERPTLEAYLGPMA